MSTRCQNPGVGQVFWTASFKKTDFTAQPRDFCSTSSEAAGNLTEALLQAAPNGIDVYFDNVGGEHLEAALTAANRLARFALCRMISQYNVAGMPVGPRNIMFTVLKSIRLEGFIVSNHFNLLPEFQKDMVRVDTRRQADVEGNRRAWHRECADSLSQVVQGGEFGKDAGEAGLKM